MRAFYDCDGLETVVLPDGLRSIGDWAFADCGKLSTLVIPASVTQLGEEVFCYDDALVLTVTPGSYAERYCRNESLPYTAVG